jgi:hypothetical protein
MTHKTNPKIESLALRLGVPMNTIYQWRRRGVPYKWRLILIKQSKGEINISNFQRLDKNG